MADEKDDDIRSKLLHLDEQSKHHEQRFEDHERRFEAHGNDIGKLYSMIHDVVVKVAVITMESSAIKKFIFGVLATLLLMLAAKFSEII